MRLGYISMGNQLDSTVRCFQRSSTFRHHARCGRTRKHRAPVGISSTNRVTGCAYAAVVELAHLLRDRGTRAVMLRGVSAR